MSVGELLDIVDKSSVVEICVYVLGADHDGDMVGRKAATGARSRDRIDVETVRVVRLGNGKMSKCGRIVTSMICWTRSAWTLCAYAVSAVDDQAIDLDIDLFDAENARRT